MSFHEDNIQKPLFMVTIANTEFTSNYSLAPILAVSTKEKLATICKALDLYVIPNIKKQDMAFVLVLGIKIERK